MKDEQVAIDTNSAPEPRRRRPYHACSQHDPGCPIHEHPENPDCCNCPQGRKRETSTVATFDVLRTLREQCSDGGHLRESPQAPCVRCKAADEIERLQHANTRLLAEIDQAVLALESPNHWEARVKSALEILK